MVTGGRRGHFGTEGQRLSREGWLCAGKETLNVILKYKTQQAHMLYTRLLAQLHRFVLTAAFNLTQPLAMTRVWLQAWL